MRSLERRLLAWVIPSLVAVGVMATGGAYYFMTQRLEAAFDHDLGDIARALLPYLRSRDGMVTLGFTEQADAVLRADSTDQIYYAVFDAWGKIAVGDTALPQPPVAPVDAPVFWNARREARPVRVVALRAMVQNEPLVVVAAETVNKRRGAERDALLSSILPAALIMLVAIVAAIFGVRRGLGPVEALRQELQARSHTHMQPIEETHVVDELKPLVHELNEMLARLESAQRSQTRFIADAAHQLRTPIAGLVAQLDLLKGDDAHLEYARQSAARLARLAQQLLSLAAADPISNPDTDFEGCDLARIAEGRADEWLRLATRRHIEIEFDLAQARVRGNAVLIAEMASNLVDNATRHAASTVRVVTRSAAGASELEVCDDGPGIPPAERDRVFERFHRLDGRDAEGSGLGLAIVREIAQRHGARVGISEGERGRGARVTVSFPAP